MFGSGYGFTPEGPEPMPHVRDRLEREERGLREQEAERQRQADQASLAAVRAQQRQEEAAALRDLEAAGPLYGELRQMCLALAPGIERLAVLLAQVGEVEDRAAQRLAPISANVTASLDTDQKVAELRSVAGLPRNRPGLQPFFLAQVLNFLRSW